MAQIGRNVALVGATRLLGNHLGIRPDPYPAFNFYIEIEGLLVGGFSECSGLQVETEVEEYAEGGLNEYSHHFRGRTTYPPLVLKHGLTMFDDLWWWQQDVTDGKVRRRNGTIYLLSPLPAKVPLPTALASTPVPVTWWNFKNAFPVKWTGPEFKADASGVAFESVELVHEGLSRPKGLLKRAGSLTSMF
jgi:phage tail-like protein